MKIFHDPKKPLRLIVFSILLLIIAFSSARGQTPKTIEDLYPGLASDPINSTTLARLPKGTLLTAGSMTIKESELTREINRSGPETRKQLTQNVFFVLEKMAAERLLQEEVLTLTQKRQGPTGESISRYLDQKFKDLQVSEEELRQYYQANKHILGDPDLDPLKESMRDFLKEQKKQKALRHYILTLGQRRQIRVNEDWVKKQNILANENPVARLRMAGKPALVLFGAMGECPCDMVSPILIELGEKYKGRIEILIISMREESILAARYGVQTIPDLIFFDHKGREIYRHVGFLPEREIEERLKQFGLI